MNDKQLRPTDREKIVIAAQKQQEKEIRLLGSIVPHDGHTLFELEMQTGKIARAEFMTGTMKYTEAFEKTKAKSKKVLVKQGHLYVSALNMRNAAKNFAKMLHPMKVHFDKKEGKLIYV